MSRITKFWQRKCRSRADILMEVRRKRVKNPVEKLLLKYYYFYCFVSECLVSKDKHEIDADGVLRKIRKYLKEDKV